MRNILGPLAFLVAVVGAAPSSFAQSAYDYPWCAVYGSRAGGGAQSCYYKTYSQCMATMSGIGGTCIPAVLPRAGALGAALLSLLIGTSFVTHEEPRRSPAGALDDHVADQVVQRVPCS